jgi:sulfotransferase
MKTYHFLSGLPRSGSTLLTSILNQNPNIHASTNSPLLDLIHYTEEYLLYNSEQYKAHPKPECAYQVLSSIPHNYYHTTQEPIVFDKSRGWVNEVQHIIDYITPNPKIICPVRNVQDIMVSFLSLIEKSEPDNFIDENLRKNNIEVNNDNRCEYLMGRQGHIGLSYHSMLEAFRKGWDRYILLVEYDDLVSNPQNEMNRIYDFIGLPRYNHNFESVETKFEEKDIVYGLKDMHKVRTRVERIYRDKSKYLSSHIINKYNRMEFWRKSTPAYKVFGL